MQIRIWSECADKVLTYLSDPDFSGEDYEEKKKISAA